MSLVLYQIYLGFQKADLSVAPLLYGAGVKIKVLQMLEAGATVVATEVGAEGIESHKKLHIVNKTQFGKKYLSFWTKNALLYFNCSYI